MDPRSITLLEWVSWQAKQPRFRRATLLVFGAILGAWGVYELAADWSTGNGILLFLATIGVVIWALRIPIPEEPEGEISFDWGLVSAGDQPVRESVLTDENIQPDKPGEEPTQTDFLKAPVPLPQILRFPLAILLALGAQWMKDIHPFGTDESQGFGTILYLFAFGMGIWSFLAGDFHLPFHPQEAEPSERKIPILSWIRVVYFIIAVLFCGFGFFFTNDKFAFWPMMAFLFGYLYWILAVGILPPIWASNWKTFFEEIWSRMTQGFGNLRIKEIRISPWKLLLLGTFLVLACLRFYRMDAVPPEMTSDHSEKLLNVMDIFRGDAYIFFGSNGGRESLQFYLLAFFIQIFHTGLTYTSLKIVSVLDGILMLPFMYLLGKEIADKRVGYLAMILAGLGYWPDTISRIGLRIPLAMLFTAITLYFFLRALRRREWNFFLWAGLALGVGLYGYTPIRVVPLVLVAALLCFLFHPDSKGSRMWAIGGFVITGITALLLFLPMIRYATVNPSEFWLRTVTRMVPEQGAVENPIVAFLSNMWKALKMFSENDGVGWFYLVPLRPALDIVCGAFFHLGIIIAIVTFLKRRNWEMAFLLLSIPILLTPSVMALALPEENPHLPRASAAIPMVFLVAAMSLGALHQFLRDKFPSLGGRMFASIAAAGFLFLSGAQSLDLTLRQYPNSYRLNCQNASELAAYMRDFSDSVGSVEDAHWIPFPYWVDGRLVGFYMGYPGSDFVIFQEDLPKYDTHGRLTLFLFLAEDAKTLDILSQLFPTGSWKKITSQYPGKDFIAFLIPGSSGEIAAQ